MKKAIIVVIAFIIGLPIIRAQDAGYGKYFIGGYYTVLIEPYILESTSESIQVTQHFLNINFRYALNRKWRVGMEYLVSVASNPVVEDPFHTIGLTLDYDVLRSKRSKLNHSCPKYLKAKIASPHNQSIVS